MRRAWTVWCIAWRWKKGQPPLILTRETGYQHFFFNSCAAAFSCVAVCCEILENFAVSFFFTLVEHRVHISGRQNLQKFSFQLYQIKFTAWCIFLLKAKIALSRQEGWTFTALLFVMTETFACCHGQGTQGSTRQKSKWSSHVCLRSLKLGSDWGGTHPRPALSEPQLVKKSALCRHVKNSFHPACSLHNSKLQNRNFKCSALQGLALSSYLAVMVDVKRLPESGGAAR